MLKRRARRPPGPVIAVVQPHRYTRLRDLFEEFCTCFNDADTVIVADVYAAGEAPIEGVDRDALVDGPARAAAIATCVPLPDAGATGRPWCAELAAPGDLVVCLGAGNITALGACAARRAGGAAAAPRRGSAGMMAAQRTHRA